MRTFFSGISLLLILFSGLYAQGEVRIPIGKTSEPTNAFIHLTLQKRIQNYNKKVSSEFDFVNPHINSPKSVNVLDEKNKFYIQSLEGCETLVFSLDSLKMLKVISHKFRSEHAALFHEKTAMGYTFSYRGNTNVFSGKPVESCFTHNKKYLWVTYYRRSFDANAIQPSAVAIIDTESDSIVRIMPTGPLPKMLAVSPDGKYLAVTHWGDNTIGIIDISSTNPNDFRYVHHLVVDYKLGLKIDDTKIVSRDSKCGFCLRGTVFTPDSKYLMVGRMGGGGIAFFQMDNMKYLGTLWGMKSNVRHLLISGNDLLLSATKPGFVQKAPVDSLVSYILRKNFTYSAWENVYVGTGVRTIAISPDGKFIYAAINNESKLSVVENSSMKVVATIHADSFPVGLAASSDGKKLIVTSQGRPTGGGNSVMIFSVQY
jgi:DNA-binding beta-propeller fold protein YncE